MNTEQIVEAVSQMSLLQVAELVKAMETKFGVSAAAPVAVAAAAGPGAAAVEEKTNFDVELKEVPADKGLGLKEAKDLVEGAPKVVKEGAEKDEANKIKKQLEDAGAKVVLK